jgi:hypothetical protein
MEGWNLKPRISMIITCTKRFPVDKAARGVKLTTDIRLVPELRNSGAIFLLPLYVFMA